MEGSSNLPRGLRNLPRIAGKRLAISSNLNRPINATQSHTGDAFSGPSYGFGFARRQRCSSESGLVEAVQSPPWIDDLLREPDSATKGGHRRCISDTPAFLRAAVAFEEPNFGLVPEIAANRQLEQQSRVQKLQYTAELERTIQVLQAEASVVCKELEFLGQQNLILNMENEALKLRLDSLYQEQRTKNLEQEMLEREIGRLQMLFQRRRQQQFHQLHKQQKKKQQQQKQRRAAKGKDLKSQCSDNLSADDGASSSQVNSVLVQT